MLALPVWRQSLRNSYDSLFSLPLHAQCGPIGLMESSLCEFVRFIFGNLLACVQETVHSYVWMDFVGKSRLRLEDRVLTNARR